MKKFLLIFAVLICYSSPFYSQMQSAGAVTGKDTELIFKDDVSLKATSVKNQALTNTCWSFSTTSFIESELIRMGKGEHDLSEMYIIRENYIDRLKDLFENHEKGTVIEGGGLPHDWIRDFREYGVLPENVYQGLNYGSSYHNHEELNSFINAVASASLEKNTESPQYHQIVNSILDIYLGKIPESFTYNGTEFTPESFTKSLGIDPDDYIEISSFTHFPFYSQSVLEVPDNWVKAKIYNVKIDELTQIMNYSLQHGYTFAWDGDISEPGFLYLKGSATVPEKIVTQEMRQKWFENGSTTDDHGMHVTGMAKDQEGNIFYKTKNSWGTARSPLGGYLYISENYMRAKTILILVNKNGVPPEIRIRLGIS